MPDSRGIEWSEHAKNMKKLMDCIRDGETLMADGAMGTQLFERGLRIGDCPENVNLEYPELPEEIARRYFEAGAQIVQTNTFGASPLRLAQFGLDDKTEEINAAAVKAARRAVGNQAYISASVGPCGRTLKPVGDITPPEIFSSIERQLRAISAEGVDLICIETMIDLAEACLAIEAAKSVTPGIPIAAMMTFDQTSNGFRTLRGVSIRDAIHGLEAAGTDIIGSNCGRGIEQMIHIAAEFRRHTSMPLAFRPSAGIPVKQGERLVYPDTPELMAQHIPRLLAHKPSIVGGCCGTTPEHIAVMAVRIRHS
jgi:5-methyltetrahydrofolate--homocysteine methyltransferase